MKSLSLLLALTVAAVLVVLIGCAANDPFDPNSLDNKKPVISFFVSQADSGQVLNPTTYSTRTFHWSGTDPDGWVEEYYVAITTALSGEAVWDSTTRTDTTMTFSPDAEGNADATFMIACRDNRGAYSDTLVQLIPMQNFPPVIEFQSDFDPLINMQREFRDADGNVIESGSAAADTVFWNWGPGNFRFLVYDLDGSNTLEPFFRYTLADDEPDSTYDQDDPRADPETSWVRAPFTVSEETNGFELNLKSVQPGPARTLSVSVRDTVGTGPVFKYTWEVRAPKGPVLYIPDTSAPNTKAFYKAYLDERYGAGNWDSYVFWKGFPDRPFTLLESMRKFEMVLWTDTGSAGNNIRTASEAGGVLEKYVHPTDASAPGRILMISKILTGTQTGLSNPFRTNVLGIKVKGTPEAPLNMSSGNQALGLPPYLPAMANTRDSVTGAIGLGLATSNISEVIYRMEFCEETYVDRFGSTKIKSCYCNDRCLEAPTDDAPWDPVVGVRSPLRSVEAQARIVGISLQLDDFEQTGAFAALNAILDFELGVSGK